MVDYPNVPNLPGVPTLPRNPAAPSPAPVPLLRSDAPGVALSQPAPSWGIFATSGPNAGKQIVKADNVVALDFRADWNVSNFPLEQGAFASYDKVTDPYTVRLRMSRGGSANDRQEFLASIEAIAPSLDLFDVNMPEGPIINVNITSYEFARRATNGVGLLSVDLTLQQIRVVATPAFQQTKQPSGADPVNGGVVETTPPTAAQIQLVQGAGFQ